MSGQDPIDRLRDTLESSRRAPVPPDLRAATLAAVRSARQQPRRHFGHVWSLAGIGVAAAGVLAVVALVLPHTPAPVANPSASLQPLPTPAPTAAPSHLSTSAPGLTPGPAHTAAPAVDFPATVFGMDVVDIATAQRLLDPTERQARPVVVKGWLTGMQGASECLPGSRPPLQTEASCQITGFLAQGADGAGSRLPVSFAPADGWVSALPADATHDNTQVVLLVHVADARAAMCPEASRNDCRQITVVDALGWYDGIDVAPIVADTTDRRGPMLDAEALDERAKTVVPGGTTFAILRTTPDQLAQFDQTFVGRTAPGGNDAIVVRMVTEDEFVSVVIGETLTAYRTGADFPRTLLGREVLTIAEARARFETDPSAPLRVAVAGYLTVPPVVRQCLNMTIVARCGAARLAPLARPVFDTDEAAPLQGSLLISSTNLPPDANQLGVVLFGHFRDSRATLCAADDRPACDEQFILEAVAWRDPVGSAPATTPTETPGAVVPAYPDAVAGIPTISVLEARQWYGRTFGTPEPLAIKAWYTPSPPIPCPWPGNVDELAVECPYGYAYLTDSPLVTATSAESGSLARPAVPYLVPRFIGAVDQDGITTLGRSVPVVVIGHVYAGRAAYCEPDEQAACYTRFVVDGIEWRDGSFVDHAAGSAAPAAAAVIARYPAADGWHLVALRSTPASEIAALDPRAVAVPELTAPPDATTALWLANLVLSGPTPTARTVVVDATGSVVELPDWPTLLDGGVIPAGWAGTYDGIPLTCDGIGKDECRAIADRLFGTVAGHIAERVLASWAKAPQRILVAGVGPRWVQWTELSPAAGAHLVIVDFGDEVPSVTHVDASGGSTVLGLTLLPPWISAALAAGQP